MIIRHNLRSALACTAAVGVLLTLALASNLCAQTPSPTPAPQSPIDGTVIEIQGQLQAVAVTGYVVPRVGEGTQPVATIGRTFIENQGDQTVSDVIQRLPQSVGSFTPIVNAGASFSPAGSATNLCGVGFNSTLILIDGFRQTLAPFPQNGFSPFIDLNTIPLAAVDRIEFLKDGASSIYGSDAIAPVINVIYKEDYKRPDLQYHYRINQSGEFEEKHVELTTSNL